MQTNVKARVSGRTFEGGISYPISAKEQIRRSVMTTMLWENQFYEDGEAIADRIVRLVKEAGFEDSRQIMFEAKEQQHLRHAPMLIAVALVKNFSLPATDIARIITRADELGEFLALYWKDGKCPIDHQVKRGLVQAFRKFNEYQLAKYNRDKGVKLRDVLRICRPKPEGQEQAELWGRVIKGTLATPDTWEVALSSGANKKEAWIRLLSEDKLGDLAFIRNLRNMQDEGISLDLIRGSFAKRTWAKMLPYQFIASARYAPRLEPEIETAMLKGLESSEKIDGAVTILVDGSGSMSVTLSAKSEITRFDAACGVAIMARELCRDVEIYRFDHSSQLVPARHGFALRDALGSPNGSTRMWSAIQSVATSHKRLIVVVTDEQTEDNGTISDANADFLAIVNVASSEKGVGYGKGSIHISGWSENVINYLREYISGSN